MAYLSFTLADAGQRKTNVWTVVNTAAGIQLGRVSFLGAWRAYVFVPNHKTLYDASCLRDIADFCESQTKQWRQNL